jgi:hypothetical protein
MGLRCMAIPASPRPRCSRQTSRHGRTQQFNPNSCVDENHSLLRRLRCLCPFRPFYQHFEFMPLPDIPNRLFLPHEDYRGVVSRRLKIQQCRDSSPPHQEADNRVADLITSAIVRFTQETGRGETRFRNEKSNFLTSSDSASGLGGRCRVLAHVC